MSVVYIDTEGNNPALIGSLHPNGTLYVAHRKDVSGGGRRLYIRQTTREGQILRTIKVYSEKITSALQKEAAAGQFPVEQVKGPLGAADVIPYPTGDLVVMIGIGHDSFTDGYAKFAWEVLYGACDQFDNTHNVYPLTVSAFDDQARQIATAAMQKIDGVRDLADRAEDMANDALTIAKDLKKRGSTSQDQGLTPTQQAQVDKSAKDAVWAFAPEVLYGAVVNDPNSPTRNIIRQEVHAALVALGLIKD